MKTITKQKELLGTVIKITVPESNSNLISKCFNELKRIEKKYSRFIDNSYINKLNSKLNEYQEVDDETLEIIKTAVKINKITNGYFDITLKRNLENLGYDKNYSFKKRLSLTNPLKSNKIKVKDNKIKLSKEIEIGGFGKGYAIDKLRQILDENHIKEYFINAGGDVFSKCNKEDSIALENPINTQYVIGEIKIKNECLCSSSSNRRKWGKDQHHLIDPNTKKPSKSDIIGLFVRHDNGLECDAYATALYCMGFDKAIEFSKKNSLSVLLISNKNKTYSSNNFNWEKY